MNKFLYFPTDTSTGSSNSTFIIGADSKVLSIDISEADELIELPDPNTVDYDTIQYRKTITTPRDIIFTYNNRQKGKLHFHRIQNIKFHKFKTAHSQPGWIC
jgi:hypothetical protein